MWFTGQTAKKPSKQTQPINPTDSRQSNPSMNEQPTLPVGDRDELDIMALFPLVF